MKRLTVIVLLALFLALSGESSAQESANWTILHYTAVDNDLEGAAFNDYYEMQSVGSGYGVNIVTQLDRAEGYDVRFGDWTDTRRFLIEYVEPLPETDINGKRDTLLNFFVEGGYGDPDSLRAEIAAADDAIVEMIYADQNVGVSFNQAPVEVLGEVDMGDPQSLTDFIVWGVQNYPAEHFMVVIGSHGGGWHGIGPDMGSGDSMLDLPEIDAALGEARTQLSIEKFDIVGFDACLMGLVEVATTLEPHADYVLFSQETIPSNGWEYTASITDLQNNPDWDAFMVGANFVDQYMAHYAGPGNRTKVGLSLVETAALPNLLAALDNFAQVVRAETTELLSALGTARNNSQLFGTTLGDRADYFSYVDLRDFMNWFSVQTTISEEAYLAAQEVLAAYDAAVVYAHSDSKLPGATGLGVYLPPNSLVYNAYGEQYPALVPASMTFWQDYLDQFYSTIASELDGSALQLDITSVLTVSGTASTLDNPVVSFNAAGLGVIDLGYAISYLEEDGTRTLVDASPLSYNTTLPTGETVIEYPNELTPSTFVWSVEFPYLSDGRNSVLALLNASSSSGTEATVQGTYISAAGSQPAYLIFDLGTLTYGGILALAENAPYEVKPAPGDQFIVDLISISPQGEINVQPLVDTPLTFGVEPFVLSYETAVSGDYEVGLSMTDLAGNNIYRSTQISIDNEGVDGSVRGFTNISEGVYFQYPRAWGDSFFFTNEDDSLTEAVGDHDGLQTLYVDAVLDMDAATLLGTQLSSLGAEVGEMSETTLGELPAFGATYRLEGENGPVYGTILSVFHEAAGAAVSFNLQSTAEDANADAAILGLLDSSLFLFDPAE